MKPKDLGYAQELWTYCKLRNHIRGSYEDAGFPGLKQISHNIVRTILERNAIKPNKIIYYLEKKDQISLPALFS